MVKSTKEYVTIDSVSGPFKCVKNSEEHFHVLLIKALRDKYPQYVIAGSTDNLKLVKSQIKKVKPYGNVRGSPDIEIRAPVTEPVETKDGEIVDKLIATSCCLELKRAKGGTVNAYQVETLHKLALTGKCYCAVVLSETDTQKGVEKAMKIVENYLDYRKHDKLIKTELAPLKPKRISKPKKVQKPKAEKKTKLKKCAK
jgi:hypothetical protein